VSPSLFSGLGNADTWLSRAAKKTGVSEGSTPEPGAIAVWNSPGVGHVAFVESVTGGSVTVSDYNYAGTGMYNAGHGLATAPSGYIYFGAGSAGGAPPLIGVLQGSTLSAKEGKLGASWVQEATGVSQVAVASDAANGPLIGAVPVKLDETSSCLCGLW
jgi:CHAP domain